MSADFRDLTGLRNSTQALRRHGFRARAASHPEQIPVMNAVSTPSAVEMQRARRLVAVFDSAERAGAGVTTDDSGHMADVAVIRSAREIPARAQPTPRPRPEDAPDGAVPRPRVTVLGSLNMDISVTAPLLPAPGMTVLGSAARFMPGGKGANQAIAAARLGADVRMVGCVGHDDFGRQLLAALRAEGVHADGVRVAAGAPTGLAMITVDPSGENLITVAPGANHEVSTDDAAAPALTAAMSW
jgi:hypothetical protein